MTLVSLISLVEAGTVWEICMLSFVCIWLPIQQLRSECFMYSSEIQPHSGAISLSSSWSTYTYRCTTSSYSSCWFKKAAKPHLQTKWGKSVKFAQVRGTQVVKMATEKSGSIFLFYFKKKKKKVTKHKSRCPSEPCSTLSVFSRYFCVFWCCMCVSFI